MLTRACGRSSATSGCPSQLDLVFVVDGSGSVGRSNWRLVTDFLIEVINRLDVGAQQVRVGMVLFSTHAQTLWGLGSRQASDRESLTAGMRDLPYLGGRTNTPGGLEKARRVLERRGR